jgi:transcriptional regulator of acetoin/glycerol metabolism
VGPPLADDAPPVGRRTTTRPPSGAHDADGAPAPARLPTPTRAELVVALEAHGWSVRATAKHYGRDRRQIYRWMESYGLSGEQRQPTRRR